MNANKTAEEGLENRSQNPSFDKREECLK